MKKTLKNIFRYIFTIDKIFLNNNKKSKLGETILGKIIFTILTLPFLYILFFGYFDDGFSVGALLKTITLLLLVRFFFKEFTDAIIFMLFHKKSYKIDDSLKYTRKRKLRKLRIKKIFRL